MQCRRVCDHWFAPQAEHDALLNESTSGTYVVQNFFETASVSGSVVTAAAERIVLCIASFVAFVYRTINRCIPCQRVPMSPLTASVL